MHKLNLIKQLRLGLAGTYYSMAHTLGLRRIQDFLQVIPPKSFRASSVQLASLLRSTLGGRQCNAQARFCPAKSCWAMR